MVKTMFYVLDGHTPVPAAYDAAFARLLSDSAARRVAKTQLTPEIEVSTVFLAIDHQWGTGPPLLFETMIFGGALNGDQWRYATWDDALAGHAAAVARAALHCPTQTLVPVAPQLPRPEGRSFSEDC